MGVFLVPNNKLNGLLISTSKVNDDSVSSECWSTKYTFFVAYGPLLLLNSKFDSRRKLSANIQ